MHTCSDSQRLTTLWNMAWNEDRLVCAIYRTEGGMQLTVEASGAVVVTEDFDLQPRALARAQALRTALKRRGWQDVSAT